MEKIYCESVEDLDTMMKHLNMLIQKKLYAVLEYNIHEYGYVCILVKNNKYTGWETIEIPEGISAKKYILPYIRENKLKRILK